jgi:hypothetical protein
MGKEVRVIIILFYIWKSGSPKFNTRINIKKIVIEDVQKGGERLTLHLLVDLTVESVFGSLNAIILGLQF